MEDKFLSLLGLARRAGKISLGHDAVKSALNRKKAKLLIFSSDVSQRLKDEFLSKISEDNCFIIETNFSMLELSKAIGSKAGVLSVDDEGFAKGLKNLYFDNKEGRLCR